MTPGVQLAVSADALDRPDVALIETALVRATTPLPAQGRRLIKSVSAKQRPRRAN